jgi:ATP-binding cassette, subfamily B, bacterial
MSTVLSTKKSYIDPKDLPRLDRTTLRRTFSYLRPYRRQSALVVLTVTVGACLDLFPPLFMKAVVDLLGKVVSGQSRGDLGELWLLCAAMVIGPLIANLLNVAEKYLTTGISEHVTADLRLQLFEHLHRLSAQYFITAKPGEILSSILNDVQGVGSVLSSTLVNVLENLIGFSAIVVLIIYLDWRLALLSLVLLPFFVLPTRQMGRMKKKLRRQAQAKLAELTGILSETLTLSGTYLIRLFGAEAFEVRRLKAKCAELVDVSLKQSLTGRWFQVVTGLFEAAGPALAFAIGGYFIIQGRQTSLGTLVAFVVALKKLYSPASSLAGIHVDLVTSYAYFERVFRVLDVQPKVVDAPHAVPLSQVEGRIDFEHVSLFMSEDQPVIRDICFSILPGKRVGIVGPSGAGKSTLTRLLLRIDDPTSGRILIDGHDLRDVQLKSLRSHIGLVSQETYLFHASVLDNVRYARPDATESDVEIAARLAQIHETITALPGGYQCIVGDRGHRLSGGERQRLSIARALLKDPRILVLDEATSSLDPTNEAVIQAVLDIILEERTTLIIAHRLSTIRNADLILVLDQGCVVERGTHDELLALDGLYAKLHREQTPAALHARPLR